MKRRRDKTDHPHPTLRNNLMPGSGSGAESSLFQSLVRANEVMFPVGGFEREAFACVNSGMFMPFDSSHTIKVA